MSAAESLYMADHILEANDELAFIRHLHLHCPDKGCLQDALPVCSRESADCARGDRAQGYDDSPQSSAQAYVQPSARIKRMFLNLKRRL